MSDQMQLVGACVLLFDSSKQKILLGKRRNSYGAGDYGLPGGKLELTESLENCAKREILEETGIRAWSVKYVGVVRELQKSVNFIHFVFLCDKYDGEPTLTEPEKCAGWEWHDVRHTPKNILRGHGAAIEMHNAASSVSLMDVYQ